VEDRPIGETRKWPILAGRPGQISEQERLKIEAGSSSGDAQHRQSQTQTMELMLRQSSARIECSKI
jgi:hypothetical protein